MKCPKCQSESLTEVTISQPIDSEIEEWDFCCTDCGWEGPESETIRTPREIAECWMFDYIVSRQVGGGHCFVNEGWSEEEEERHIDFVELCFSKGIKPTHFVDTMISDYESWITLADEFDIEDEE